MTQAELMKTVKAKLPTRQAITVNFVQQRYRVLQSQARRCIEDLQDEGLISRNWSTELGGYPVTFQIGVKEL
jgi:ribosomal protein S25